MSSYLTYTYGLEDEIDLKQHINLSESAWLVINSDIADFYAAKSKASFSGFLNIIFLNSYQNADSSIDIRVDEKYSELEKLSLDDEFKDFDKNLINDFITKYTNIYEKKLVEKALSYSSGPGGQFRINKENVSILKDDIEATHYESLGLYLKAIFEEYSRKPRYIREQIFFRPFLDKISLAIARQKKLKITLASKIRTKDNIEYSKKFLVSPYKIMQDKTYSFNYLVGFCEEIIDKQIIDENGVSRKSYELRDKIPVCLRLSNIEKCDIQVSMGAHISKQDKDLFNKLVNERDVMYLTSNQTEIKVKFTDKGLESFRRQIYMRPNIYEVDKNDNHIYIFNCSEIQALNYFFKFGWDALILSPDSLANKFKDRYEKALKTYNGLTKEEIIKSEK